MPYFVVVIPAVEKRHVDMCICTQSEECLNQMH